MTTTIEDFHDEIIKIQAIIESKNLDGEVNGYVNWIGDELDISLSAREEYDSNGYWKREVRFSGLKTEASELLDKAQVWAYNLPHTDDRAIEFMIQQLNKLVEKLPRGHSEASVAAWEEIAKMLLARAESIAKNGLPSPASISSVGKVLTPKKRKVNDDIPF